MNLADLHSKSNTNTSNKNTKTKNTQTTEKNKTSFSASLHSWSTLKHSTFFIPSDYFKWMKVQIDGSSKFCNRLLILFNTGKNELHVFKAQFYGFPISIT